MNFSHSAAIYEHAPETVQSGERERRGRENKRQCINKELKLQFNVIELCEICPGLRQELERTSKSINNIFDLKLKLNSIKTFSLLVCTHMWYAYLVCVSVCLCLRVKPEVNATDYLHYL